MDIRGHSSLRKNPAPDEDQFRHGAELDVRVLGHLPEHRPSLVGCHPAERNDRSDGLVDHGMREHRIPALIDFFLKLDNPVGLVARLVLYRCHHPPSHFAVS